MTRPGVASLMFVAAGLSTIAVFAGCGSDSSDPQAAEVEDVLRGYLSAVDEGRGEEACALLTSEAQLGVFDFRLVHAGADHPDEACARIVSTNRLEGEVRAGEIEVAAIEVDGASATATVNGAGAELELVDGEWKIARFGLAESVVPGDRPPPKPRPTGIS